VVEGEGQSQFVGHWQWLVGLTLKVQSPTMIVIKVTMAGSPENAGLAMTNPMSTVEDKDSGKLRGNMPRWFLLVPAGS